MSKTKMEYMTQVRVRSIGAGCVIDENGRTLRVIGNLPINAGDVVWTDGRIVYGHKPVRPSVNIVSKTGAIPAVGFGEVFMRRNGIPKGRQIWDAPWVFYEPPARGIQYLSDVWNWMVTSKDAVYCASGHPPVGQDDDDLNFFLDLICTNGAVYTAEYTSEDEPFQGKYVDSAVRFRQLHFGAKNFYLTSDPATGEFTFNWTPAGGALTGNPVVRIKRNKNIIQEFSLSDYQNFALDTLKEIYNSYDYYDEELKDCKRYRQEGQYDEDYLKNVDIWCSYVSGQILNFHFTDDYGNWEMIISNCAEGVCSPHTVDIEYSYKTHQFENIYSFFHVYCPIIYYIMRIRSNGEPEILHQWIVINKKENNGVEREDREWVNAMEYPVEEVEIREEPYFQINYMDCSMETNLRKVKNIQSVTGVSIPDEYSLQSFRYLYVSNPDKEVMSEGAINSTLRVNLLTGRETVVSTQISKFMSDQQNYGIAHDTMRKIIQLVNNSMSYFGRLSVYKTTTDNYLFSLHLQWLYGKDGPILLYPFNLNFNYIDNVKKMKNLKTIDDLIADS